MFGSNPINSSIVFFLFRYVYRFLFLFSLPILAIASEVTHIKKIENKVIYGEDNRKDLYQVLSSKHLEIAKATAILMDINKLQDLQNGYTKINGKSFGETYALCEEEPFKEQLSAGFCSGFLVSDKVLVTAGHCIRNEATCQKSKFIFDFAMNNIDQDLSEILNDKIFGCKKLIHSEVNGTGPDFAVIELDRPVSDRSALLVRTSGSVAINDPLLVVGYPSGIPVKVAGGANVRSTSVGFFTANLDTYGGNSGSAVLNEITGEVEGILVRGASDFVFKNNCRASNICENEACRGEDVTFINAILNYLP